VSNLLLHSLFRPEGLDLMYDNNAGGNHYQDVRDEWRTVADEPLGKLRIGDAHQIYVCKESIQRSPAQRIASVMMAFVMMA
jgi:hypothetical protein